MASKVQPYGKQSSTMACAFGWLNILQDTAQTIGAKPAI
jgi:hypothetical protein